MQQEGAVNIDIFNIRGQKVKTLVNEHQDAGNHYAVWNGEDDNGSSVGSGIFFYKMRAGKFTSTKKMILMK
jgi:flagellar hook assembly protein FlgD